MSPPLLADTQWWIDGQANSSAGRRPVLPDDQRWQTQTRMFDPENPGGGDCTETAVASLLAIPRDCVPDFAQGTNDGGVQYENLVKFLESMGFAVFMRPANWEPNCLYLAMGPSPRGCSHCVIMRDGQLVHDPHPSRAGLIRVGLIYMVVAVDPAMALPMPPNPWPEDLT